MSDNIEIKQNTNLGKENTQIGIQNNYNGLTVGDAMDMVLKMFREYYPKLREEILKDLRCDVEEKLKNIPNENIVPPNPRIAIPVLQNASITEEKDLRKMYANLLANSMNKVVKNGVHPGFVQIINQLSPDEAKILKYIYGVKVIPTITVRYEAEDGAGYDIVRNFSIIGTLIECEEKIRLNKYFDNLIRLGLVYSSNALSHLTDKSKYVPLKEDKFILDLIEKAKKYKEPYNNAKINEGFIAITDYGLEFCSNCLDKYFGIITLSLKKNV